MENDACPAPLGDKTNTTNEAEEKLVRQQREMEEMKKLTEINNKGSVLLADFV